jgi:glycosyltransferase involved in cell wall biosynthesis
VQRRPRVCIFSEYLYPVVSGGRVPFAGGIEVQLALIGEGLAQSGFDVSVVTCDFGQPDALRVHGMEFLKCYPPRAGLPVVRFFHPRLTGGIAALGRANADIYIFEGAALWAGIVRDLAAAKGRRFVWMVAHDHDVMGALPDVFGVRDRTWVRRAILRADAVVSQTEKQRRQLLQDFGTDSVVIANSVQLPPASQVADVGRDGSLAWLATYKPSKRPEWFTRFAERHPNVRCRMVGVVPLPPLDERCWRDAQAVAARTPNLEVHPTLPHEQVGAFLRESVLFAHSSPAEGFPNAFLEAWAHGLPAVTCFDPDGILVREQLGACCDEYDTWELELERRLADPGLRQAEGARARAYVARHHAPDLIHARLAAVMHGVLGGVPELVS